MKNSFLQDLKKIITSKQVLIGMFATISLLIFFRFGASILLPGVSLNSDVTTDISFIDIMSLISGNGNSELSYFAVGISPYITAQIIVQLLSSDVIRPLSRLTKSGEKGRRKIEVITRILTIPFAVMQAYAMISISLSQGLITIDGVSSLSELSSLSIFKIIFALTSGSLVSLFIADIISKRGIGNGITLIILSGVLSQIFSNFKVVFEQLVNQGSSSNEILLDYLSFFSYVILFLLLVVGVVIINGAVRKIPIQQTGNSLTTNLDEMAFLPIKVNSAGVIPVIFASSIITIPTTIVQLFNTEGAEQINNIIGLTTPGGMALYGVLIILFSFLYSYIQLNPEQIATNFRKSGKYIPGIKSGTQTEKYISRILIRINFIGAPILAIIALIPYIISAVTGISSGIAIGGTGVIIIVTGSADFWQALLSAQTNYKYTKTKKDIQQTHVDERSSNIDEVTHLW